MGTKMLLQLREATGAPITACQKALQDTNGDIAKATEILRKKGLEVVDKKAGRDMGEGLIDAYIHGTSKMGALVQVVCETDFVARTPQFKDFVHEVALQVVASAPLYVSRTEIPQDLLDAQRVAWREEVQKMGKPAAVAENILKGKIEKWYQEMCLLEQPYIKDEEKKMEDLLKETVAKLGENIKIKRFVRFSL